MKRLDKTFYSSNVVLGIREFQAIIEEIFFSPKIIFMSVVCLKNMFMCWNFVLKNTVQYFFVAEDW